jgi:hypothetical protein
MPLTCTCIDHRPTGDVRCLSSAVYRLKDEDGTAELCRRHAKALVDMYEPGQIRRIRDRKPLVPRRET